MKNNTQPALKERIEKALEDFTKGRASMHVPPLDTDVDMVLAECSDRLSALEARCAALAAENAGLNNFIASSCYVLAGEEAAWHPAIDHAPETPATNQLSIKESQFLTDVMTAAGLLSCGKRDKQLAQRLADFCVSKRGGSNPAQLRKGVQS